MGDQYRLEVGSFALPSNFDISKYCPLLSSTFPCVELAKKLAAPHSCQQHVEYLEKYWRLVTTFSECLIVYFHSLWILSAYRRLEDVSDPIVRSILQGRVRKVAFLLLHVSPQHVITTLQVSATIVCCMHERYLSQTATSGGSFPVTAFYGLPPTLVNNPHFLVCLLDSLLNEAGHVGSNVIMQQASKILADHPIVETILDWKVVPTADNESQVWYFTTLRQLEGCTTMWVNRVELVKGAQNRVAVERYEEHLGAQTISITFAPLELRKDGESDEMYKLIAEHPTKPAGKRRRNNDVSAPRLVTRAEIVRMNIPSWMAKLKTCESEFRGVSKVEEDVCWVLSFHQVNKRRLWKKVPPMFEATLQLRFSQHKSTLKEMLRNLSRQMPRRCVGEVDRDNDEDEMCPCGECHTDSDDETHELTDSEMDKLTEKVESVLANQCRGLAVTDALSFQLADTKTILPLYSTIPATVDISHQDVELAKGTTRSPNTQSTWNSAATITFQPSSVFPPLKTTAAPQNHSVVVAECAEQEQQSMSITDENDGTSIEADTSTVGEGSSEALPSFPIPCSRGGSDLSAAVNHVGRERTVASPPLTPPTTPPPSKTIRLSTPRTPSTPATPKHNPCCVCFRKPATVVLLPCQEQRLCADCWKTYLAEEKAVHARNERARKKLFMGNFVTATFVPLCPNCRRVVNSSFVPFMN